MFFGAIYSSQLKPIIYPAYRSQSTSNTSIMRRVLLFNQKWKNPMLGWNTSYYGGIKSVNVDPAKVWIPDVILYNK